MDWPRGNNRPECRAPHHPGGGRAAFIASASRRLSCATDRRSCALQFARSRPRSRRRAPVIAAMSRSPASVMCACGRLPGHEAEPFQPGDLPADRRMVAARLPGQLDDADRPGPRDPHQQGKQRPVERDPCLPQQHLVLARAVQGAHQIDQRPCEQIEIMCIMHGLRPSGSNVELRA